MRSQTASPMTAHKRARLLGAIKNAIGSITLSDVGKVRTAYRLLEDDALSTGMGDPNSITQQGLNQPAMPADDNTLSAQEVVAAIKKLIGAGLDDDGVLMQICQLLADNGFACDDSHGVPQDAGNMAESHYPRDHRSFLRSVGAKTNGRNTIDVSESAEDLMHRINTGHSLREQAEIDEGAKRMARLLR